MWAAGKCPCFFMYIYLRSFYSVSLGLQPGWLKLFLLISRLDKKTCLEFIKCWNWNQLFHSFPSYRIGYEYVHLADYNRWKLIYIDELVKILLPSTRYFGKKTLLPFFRQVESEMEPLPEKILLDSKNLLSDYFLKMRLQTGSSKLKSFNQKVIGTFQRSGSYLRFLS